MPETYRDFLQNGGLSGNPLVHGEGLGLWVVRRLLDEAGASAAVEAGPGGTRVRLTFPIAMEEIRHVA
jgi:two-component sensor histidine kinase